MTIIQANKFYFLKGGAERYVFDLSSWLKKQGHLVVPFAMQHPKNLDTPYQIYFPSQVQTQDVRFGFGALRTVARMLASPEARKRMKTLVKDLGPSLCHVHNIYTQISPSIFTPLRRAGVPMVMTVHDYHLISPHYSSWAEGCGPDYSRYGILRGTLSKFHKHSYAASFAQTLAFKVHAWRRVYQKNIDAFISPSQYLAQRLVKGGFDARKVYVIPYGIDAQRIQPWYEDDRYLLYVGRLSEEKGIETVIHMARLLPDIPFKIVGTGPDEERLHRLAHGIPNIEFLGFKMGEDLSELYRKATACLVPSRWNEVFGLTILEALARGKPVIASHVGGIPEIIEDRVNGFLVKPLDLHGWVEAGARVFHDEPLRRHLGKQARLSVETRFREEEHFKKVAALYDRVISGYTRG